MHTRGCEPPCKEERDLSGREKDKGEESPARIPERVAISEKKRAHLTSRLRLAQLSFRPPHLGSTYAAPIHSVIVVPILSYSGFDISLISKTRALEGSKVPCTFGPISTLTAHRNDIKREGETLIRLDSEYGVS